MANATSSFAILALRLGYLPAPVVLTRSRATCNPTMLSLVSSRAGQRRSSRPSAAANTHSRNSGSRLTYSSWPAHCLPTQCPRSYTDALPSRPTRRTTTYSARCSNAPLRFQCRRSHVRAYGCPEWHQWGNAAARLRPSMLGYRLRWMSSAHSSRRCNSAASAQVCGSTQPLLTPWVRSTTPFGCGHRGAFHVTATSKPNSHRANSVGKPPVAPHGVPLSTRNCSGRPQRANARRNSAWTAAAPTNDQEPWGENAGPANGPAAFVRHAQPTDAPAIAQAYPLGRVHLPDFVRLGGTAGPTLGGEAASPRCGSQPRLPEPTLQRPRAGQGWSKALRQIHEDEAGSPAQVLPPQAQRRLLHLLALGRRLPPIPVGRRQGLGATVAETPHQMVNGAQRHLQGLGNGSSGLSALAPPPNRAPDGNRDSTRHGIAPCTEWLDRRRASSCQRKPNQLSWQNLMSQSRAKPVSEFQCKTTCRVTSARPTVGMYPSRSA